MLGAIVDARSGEKTRTTAWRRHWPFWRANWAELLLVWGTWLGLAVLLLRFIGAYGTNAP
jgi:hypothetical protein